MPNRSIQPTAGRARICVTLGAVCVSLLFLWFTAGAAVALTEESIDRSFAIRAGGNLIVRADRGEVTLATTNAETVTVRVIRSVGAAGEGAGILSSHEVSFSQSTNEIVVQAGSNRSAATPWPTRQPGETDAPVPLRVRFEILLPRVFNVQISTTEGNVTLPDLAGKVQVEVSGGTVRLGQIHGAVEGKLGRGNLVLARCVGPVRVQVSHGDIEVGEVTGPAILQTSRGSIRVAASGESLEARTALGQLHVLNARGPIQAKAQAGSITIGHAASTIKADAAGGDVSLERVDGGATVSIQSGSLFAQHVMANLAAHTAGGDIRVDYLWGTLQARATGGSIRAGLAGQPDSDSRVEAAAGNIELSLASTLALNLDARATAGELRLGLPLDPLTAHSAAGTVKVALNGGGPALLLRSQGGDISLSQLSPELSARRPASDLGESLLGRDRVE